MRWSAILRGLVRGALLVALYLVANLAIRIGRRMAA